MIKVYDASDITISLVIVTRLNFIKMEVPKRRRKNTIGVKYVRGSIIDTRTQDNPLPAMDVEI